MPASYPAFSRGVQARLQRAPARGAAVPAGPLAGRCRVGLRDRRIGRA